MGAVRGGDGHSLRAGAQLKPVLFVTGNAEDNALADVAEHTAFLAQNADVTARSRNANGNTPLHAALAGNHKLVAGLLIGAGADVNAADANGWMPLHLAAANNNMDAIKALIAQGADVAAANGEAKTALSLATEKNHREAAALLRRFGA